MAENMSDMAGSLPERRIRFTDPPLQTGLRIHDVGHHGRDYHSPVGHPHWFRRHYALIWQMRDEGFFESAATAWRRTRAGDLLICMPGLWHNYGPLPCRLWEEYYVFFDGPVADSLAALGLLDQGQQVLRVGRDQALEASFSRLVDRAETGPHHELTDRTFTLINRLLHRARPARRDTAAIPALAAVVRDICADPGSDWNIHALAASCGQSYDAFRKAFRRRYELPPQAFLLRERMHLACRLLAEGHRVHETCRLVGMHDPFHFSRQFKRIIGRSPR
ncbi:MAG: helix-turn-helix transcriptional regulator, partial [Planctomycetota bacterium]